MANKISGIDGRPVQVGGGAPVSRSRDATDGRKTETTCSTSNIDVSDTARTLAALEEQDCRPAGGQRERAWTPCAAPSTKAATTSTRSASPTRCCASKATCWPPSRPTSNTRPNVDAALTRDHLARLLAEENTALTEFESLLDREHAALRVA